MRQFFTLLLFSLFILTAYHGSTQDLLVTQKQDSLKCTITDSSKKKVYYEIQKDGSTQTFSMKRSAVKEMKYNFYASPAAAPSKPTSIAIGSDTLRSSKTDVADSKKKDSRMDSKFRVYGGYQIGGFTLAGFDVSYGNKIAIHAGGGVQGYTFGLRVFPIRNTDININLSYKDGGHGDIETLGAEVGAMIIPFDKNTGIYVQIGYANVLTVNERLSEELFDNEEAPFGIVSIGLGIRIY